MGKKEGREVGRKEHTREDCLNSSSRNVTYPDHVVLAEHLAGGMEQCRRTSQCWLHLVFSILRRFISLSEDCTASIWNSEVRVLLYAQHTWVGVRVQRSLILPLV